MGPEMVRGPGDIEYQDSPHPIFPRKLKPWGVGGVGTAGDLGPQDSPAAAHRTLQHPQGPIRGCSGRCSKNPRCLEGRIFKLSG